MYKVVIYPDPILRQKCEKITNPTDPAIKQLIAEMVQTMRSNEGLGLAAPQVGKNLQLCVIEIEDEVFVLMNPVIKNASGKKLIVEEGCLSFPGKFLPVERFEKVKVKAIDANGRKQVIRARGLLARALQHEIDHLSGVLYIDKAISHNQEH